MASSLNHFLLDLLRQCLWLVLLIVIFVPVERRFALHSQKFVRKAFGTDLVYYFISALVPKLILIPPMALVAAVLHHFVPLSFYAWTDALPTAVRFFAALMVGDVGAYWGHRWSHELPILWRFHAIHHSAEEIDWLVNSRAHPVDMVFTRLCGLIPVYALGLAQPFSDRVDLVPVLITIAGTLWGFFIHANVNWRLGFLEEIVSSPAFHHWHHTNDSPDVLNKNYSAMLPWVDRCFGTFYLPDTKWPVKYGTDTFVGNDLGEQLIHPLLPDAGAPASVAE